MAGVPLMAGHVAGIEFEPPSEFLRAGFEVPIESIEGKRERNVRFG